MPQRLDLSWTSEDTIKSSFMDYVGGAPHKFVSGYAQPKEFRSKNPIAIETVGVGSVDPFLGLLAVKRAASARRLQRDKTDI